jgi:serine/threonine protein phosphatase PrpC
LRIEYAEISLQGGREDNQDRGAVAAAEDAALIAAVDGMGGHSDGARAAEITLQVLQERFRQTPQPLFDPLGFLHLTLGQAHEQVVQLGQDIPMDQRPRATCAVCLVQLGAAWFAHIGDSRIYHLRAGAVVGRTRDHSHVEFLIREGTLSRAQAASHPMRNFVESCVGGEPVLPEMSIAMPRPLQPNDVLLCCTDGFWGGLGDEDIARGMAGTDLPFRDALQKLAQKAVASNGPSSDNTTCIALRWLGP